MLIKLHDLSYNCHQGYTLQNVLLHKSSFLSPGIRLVLTDPEWLVSLHIQSNRKYPAA